MNVVWNSRSRASKVAFLDPGEAKFPPEHRDAFGVALPVRAPQVLAACHTDMTMQEFSALVPLIRPAVGEVAPVLKPPSSQRTLPEVYDRHKDNRALAMLDWAESSMENPATASDVHRISVILDGLLASRGTERTVYSDIDDLDTLRRTTQGVADGVKAIEDVDEIGGVPPRFEGCSSDEISEMLGASATFMPSDELRQVVVPAVKAAVILGDSISEALGTYMGRSVRSRQSGFTQTLETQIIALLGTPEVKAFRSDEAPKHLGRILAAADATVAASGQTAEQREQARIHVTRAMILGPFQDALRNGVGFEKAASDCGLTDERFNGAMLEIASRIGAKGVRELPVRMKSVAFWRSGGMEKVETHVDFDVHKRQLRERFETDLSPEAQALHLARHSVSVSHPPGLMALEEEDGLTVGHQSTISGYGPEGIAAAEAVAIEMARSVFMRHLPGSGSDARSAELEGLRTTPFKVLSRTRGTLPIGLTNQEIKNLASGC